MTILDPYAVVDAAKERADNEAQALDQRVEQLQKEISEALIINESAHGYDRRDVENWLDDEAWFDIVFRMMWAVYNPRTKFEILQQVSQEIRERIDDRIKMLAEEEAKHERDLREAIDKVEKIEVTEIDIVE